MGHQFLPINLKMKDKSCLVVGGGKAALRKIAVLLDYGCKLTVIAPEFEQQIEYYAQKEFLKIIKRPYQSPEAGAFDIAVAASNDVALNEQIAKDCRKMKVPVNIINVPELCDFTFPAVLRRDCLTVSVSTDGEAPFLAGQLRVILETLFPDRWAKIAQTASKYRKIATRKWGNNPDQRLRAYERFLSADWKKILEEMSDKEIDDYINRLAEGAVNKPQAEE